ncbi:hypothetical protein XENTR_v10021089 [Xenopus tropicalis]|nr:hypothetical protein XENTR_v10021089 [Xenopus tropicalis]
MALVCSKTNCGNILSLQCLLDLPTILVTCFPNILFTQFWLSTIQDSTSIVIRLISQMSATVHPYSQLGVDELAI